MQPGAKIESLVGRSDEVQSIRQAVEALGQGRGSALLFVGEPGIGKSTLATCAADLARSEGHPVYWGYSWEAGGAPAYWPWTQLLRSLAAEQSLSEAEQASLSLLLPEFAGGSADSADLQPEQARFQLLDSVRIAIARLAARSPMVLIFEDIHAADIDTLKLLNYLVRHIKSVPVLVIGTYREFEARTSPGSELLWQLGRDAAVMHLFRLARGDVVEYLAAKTGKQPAESEVDAWFEVTSGNPLFLSELSGLLCRPGGDYFEGARLPDTIEQVIRQQIGHLPEEVGRLLTEASILGKAFDYASLAAFAQVDEPELRDLLETAVASGVLVRAGPERFEFSHGLYRDVLYAALPGVERARLHLQFAEALKSRVAHGDADGWSELATHLAAAGPEHRGAAIEAWRHAASRASARLAFDDAALLLRKAVARIAEGSGSSPADRYAILLECAQAMLLAGNIEDGHARCTEAFEIARTMDDAQLMAKAALTYGSAIVVAAVDQVLINMLRDCLDALPETDVAWRARVLARLAAALQPSANPAEPMEMARRAIEKARCSGDPAVLYDVLRNAIAALMDFAPPAERKLLNEEFLALASEAGDFTAQFRSHLRLMIDAGELADRDAYDRAIA
ncbi:MAG: AAA family ATPase, partial [Xanthomonadales bacterium]|nr:AAA family ATPase [Xanthomonadales bacterium]